MTGLPPSAHWPTHLPARKPSVVRGHINPLYAQDKGVLRRAGHTEAAVDLARLAGLQPAAALIEILNPDGTMARMPELQKVSARFGIKIIAIRDLIAYRLKQESMVERGPEVDMPTDLRTLPRHYFPPDQQRAGTRGTYQRRMGTGRTDF